MSKVSCDGTVKTKYDIGTDLSLDTDVLQVAAAPVKAAKETARDVKALYSAGEGVVKTIQANDKDVKGQRKLGTRGVLKGIQYSLEDAAGLYVTSKDEATREQLNNAIETTPAALAGMDLQGYAAGYNTTHNQIYLNTQGTDLSQGGEVMASLHHEAQRKENQDNAFLHTLSDEQQANLARFRGDRAQKVWDRLTDSNPTASPAAAQAWNHQHAPTLAGSNTRVAQAKDQDVKPREYNLHVDEAYKLTTPKISASDIIKPVSEKGGNTDDYWNIHTTDEHGNRVLKETIHTERGEGSMHAFRLRDDGKGTISICTIALIPTLSKILMRICMPS